MKQILFTLIVILSLSLYACGDEGAVTYDTEGFNTVTPQSADDSGSGGTPGTTSTNCRSKAYYDYYDCGTNTLTDNGTDNSSGTGTSTVDVDTSPVTLDLKSGKFCSFSSATSNASYFTQSSGPGTADTRTYALGSNEYGNINNTASTDPMGITLMDMREPTTQLSGGDSGLFALQNKTETDTQFGKLTVNHKPAVNVQLFGSSLGEGEYLLKSHQMNFDSKYGKSSWKVSAGHRATYILTNTGYLLSSGDNSWSQQVNEYSYDDVNGEFVYGENIGGDENYPNQGNNTDRHFKNVLDVSAGAYHVCMIHGQRDVGGRIWCKGKSNHGQALYDGSASTANQYKDNLTSMTPAELEKLDEVNWHKHADDKDYVLIGSGYNHSCALRKNAEVRCWGSNEKGQSGQPLETTSVMTPSTVMLENGTPLYAKFLYASRNSTYAIDINGRLYSWGSNEFGKLGTTAIAADGMTHVPQRVGTATNWTDVASYNHHVVGVQGEGKDRKFFGWGDNTKKQLSLDFMTHFLEPIEIFLPANENF